ncbi:MAG: RHS repeat domain-containing protein [Flavobacteriales bacterium]
MNKQLQHIENTWNTPYLFNAKELDEETGLYYYGARYYEPRISLWLSVDPLAEQTMTPYQYTCQNPVRFVDPTGSRQHLIVMKQVQCLIILKRMHQMVQMFV